MHVAGWVKTSLIDYPEHITTVLFTSGCNFRCPMCHNADLVLSPQSQPRIPLEEIWTFLERRRGILTGVTVTGGEPTLQPGLTAFVEHARALGYAIKVDTNGYRPEVLEKLLDRGIVDYVAMDIKGPPETYARLAGVADVEVTRIDRSLQVLRESDVAYELRTTVVPGLLDSGDIIAIARWIAGSEHYVLQQFRGRKTLDPTLNGAAPYPPDQLRQMAEAARAHVGRVSLRGL
ncbi:MAG: anaerobic ribonucleoside-triphosphate reductase activating protein [Anaerolineae bacterium]